MSHKQVKILKDEILFQMGDQADCAYVIDSGKVQVYVVKNQVETKLAEIRKGEIFGEMALIDNSPRSACVRALEDTVLNVITKEQLLQRYSSADSVMQLLLKVMMNRVRKNNSTLIQATSSTDEIKGQEEAYFSDALENIRLENRLHEALQKEEFEMFYQPIVDMSVHKIIGCEALIRWKDPVNGYISPDKFIDFLETSPLMIPVGLWIFDRCFKDLKPLIEQFGSDFVMSINVSGNQFTHPDFLKHLEQLTWKHQVNPQNIKLEMTERVMMDGTVAIDILGQCQNKGFHISIDDFGTGFSSLQYLSQMPVNYLKIDKSFVSKITKDNKAYAVVKSIIFMAQALGMDIIAEGVETADEREALINMGAHFVQGWLYSKALPLDQFLKLQLYFSTQQKVA